MKILSFDLDGTLFANNIDDRLWFDLIPKALADEKGISIEEARDYVSKEYDLIGFNDVRWYIPEYWLDRFNLSIDIDSLLDEMDYARYIYDDVITLKELAYGYKIVIASNNARSMLDRKVKAISSLGIDIHASFSVVSDLNMTGKNRAFYEYMCNKLEVKPYEIMHVGDNMIYDLLHARASGLRSMLIDRSNMLHGYDVIHSLYDLKDVISKA